MASPLLYGADDDMDDDSTDPTYIPPPPALSSPYDVSATAAAHILAALSDSRPPTSQGEHDGHDAHDVDDDPAGGIALTDDHQAIMTAQDADHVDLLSVDGAYAPLNLTSWLMTAEASLHDALDQHAAALESLTMAQPTIPSSLAPVAPDQLLPLPNIAPTWSSLHDLDLEILSAGDDYYPGVENKDKFVDISRFFNQVVLHDKDTTTMPLDGVDRPSSITRHDLRGDAFDMQGIDWSIRNTTKAAIRAKRTAWEGSRMPVRLRAVRKNVPPSLNTEDFFAFRRMTTRHHAQIPHFQLRNLIAATSRNDVFYSTLHQVKRTDALGSPATTTMDLSKEISDGYHFSITTLAAGHDVLIAGGFEGEYALTGLSASYDTKYTIGRITHHSRNAKSHITNHMHLYSSRHTYTPQVAFCSNDDRLRILDCETNTFTHSFVYPEAVNCSATSPDGRMRVVVGDFLETLITNAETGQPFETLSAHTDGVFACDWADDGIQVATAAQDTSIAIWDARNWSEPLKVMYSELSVPRCLKFSPVGGGPRVLVSAEADDFVSIINAQTYESRQVFDFFGRTAGIDMTPDGQSLFVANSEPSFGGIMEFERCGWGEDKTVRRFDDDYYHTSPSDWMADEDMDTDSRVTCGWRERQRRGVDLSHIAV
ncbi:hypothetical protein EJ04DRAFT_354996 [Polyplosphaeria fusca]|uniref:Uncharacterized protein n=1 Tax=Polyplosphaeria fusca TaxID=682080 RepID=A0A9P4R9B2_9PLEO|nr:hypothetical protein EJ04DRAFT_354996 [Polyplosphaeria fusca]